jgi:hypothetical protein
MCYGGDAGAIAIDIILIKLELRTMITNLPNYGLTPGSGIHETLLRISDRLDFSLRVIRSLPIGRNKAVEGAGPEEIAE